MPEVTFNCSQGMWKCKGIDHCIEQRFVCNGGVDRLDACFDGSDEHNCSEWDCLEGYWKCKDQSKCITVDQVCNGFLEPYHGYSLESDCKDGSDESDCEQWTCPEGFFKCHDQTKCIHSKFVCDGDQFDYSKYADQYLDCQDDSDELHCEEWECLPDFWKCADNRTCVKRRSIMDGIPDCNDGSDELQRYHIGRTCLEGEYKCDNLQCLPSDVRVCPGHAICSDNSDELLCEQWNCTPGFWKCDDNVQCIAAEFVCDGSNNNDNDNNNNGCTDGSDEAHCEEWECPQNLWKCADNMQCILAEKVCDDQPDCRDKSDDHNLLCNYCNQETEWPCNDGNGCAHRDKVCDGEQHCNDGSDEFDNICMTWKCSVGKTKCENNLQCINVTATCDGKTDCQDSSDEYEDFCLHYTCLDGYVKCANKLGCVHQEHICDEHEIIHCTDGSDELCSAFCLNSPLNGKSIIKKCSEQTDLCFPVNRYCDGVADCPLGSDEAQSDCICENWGLVCCGQLWV